MYKTYRKFTDQQKEEFKAISVFTLNHVYQEFGLFTVIEDGKPVEFDMELD